MFPFARCSFQVTWQSSRAKSRKPRAHDPIGIDISRVGLLESDPPKGFSTEENSPGHLLSSLGERWTEKFLAHVRVSVAYTKVGKEVASQWRRIRVRDQFPVQHRSSRRSSSCIKQLWNYVRGACWISMPLEEQIRLQVRKDRGNL